MDKDEILKQHYREIGLKSVAVMKERGRDSKFFSEMANKRWKKHFASPTSAHDAPQVSSGGEGK